MSILRSLGVCAALGLACARPDPAPLSTGAAAPLTTEKGGDAHLLVTLQLSGGALRVLDARRVPMPLQVLRGEAPGRWVVEARSGDGALLHAVRLDAPDEVRGEFQAPGGGIESHRVHLDRAAFAVRFPILPAASELRVLAPGGGPGVQRVVGSIAFPEVGK